MWKNCLASCPAFAMRRATQWTSLKRVAKVCRAGSSSRKEQWSCCSIVSIYKDHWRGASEWPYRFLKTGSTKTWELVGDLGWAIIHKIQHQSVGSVPVQETWTSAKILETSTPNTKSFPRAAQVKSNLRLVLPGVNACIWSIIWALSSQAKT